MNQPLLTLRFKPQVDLALSTLHSDDRRIVEGWLEHIRHWHSDEDIRSRSRKLKPDDELYAVQLSSPALIIAFRVDGNEATILTVMSSEWLPYFQNVGSAT